jgi:F0F1-type ATP synthase membrane subunit c/vacuolar-type H+-ATPase subunit K
MFASSVIMMAIPETVIILGFVIAVMIMLVLPGA